MRAYWHRKNRERSESEKIDPEALIGLSEQSSHKVDCEKTFFVFMRQIVTHSEKKQQQEN